MNFFKGLTGRITANMNETLTHVFIGEEVYVALQQINPTKSTGPDEMAAWCQFSSKNIGTLLAKI